MKRIRLFLVAAALCLIAISMLAGPANAWGGTNQGPCPGQYPCAVGYPYPYQYQYQYVYRYPYPYQHVYRYPYQYTNPYPYPCQYPCAPGRPLPPPPPPVYYVPGITTAYGDYTRCAQYRIHQSNCFVPDASNSPNLGSIQLEPGITIWGNCNAGQTMNRSGTDYQCSKTGAGWFPL